MTLPLDRGQREWSKFEETPGGEVAVRVTSTASDPVDTIMANVAAGAATDATFYYYLPVDGMKFTGLQFEWTAGTGTVTVTIEGTCQGLVTVPSSLTYRDITSAIFQVASWTDDFMAIDNSGKMGALSYIRVKVVTLTTDANTAWVLYALQVA